MVNELFGALVGESLGSTSYPLFGGVTQVVFDAIFLIIIGVSYFLYYKMYKVSKERKIPIYLERSFTYFILALSLLNIIFVGVILQFTYIRLVHGVVPPPFFDVVFFVVALTVLCIIIKSYEVLTMGVAPARTAKKRTTNRRSSGIKSTKRKKG